MNLTLNQFETLVYIERHQNDKCTQRRLAKKLDLSLGVINKTLTELQDSEVIKPEAALCTMLPSRLRGTGALSREEGDLSCGRLWIPHGSDHLEYTKPLVLVHGKRIIETLLDAVVAAGIEDITIVRGYLGEQFDVLLHKYPKIKFIENPLFNETNNISSAYLIKDMMCNAYVLESDLLLYNPEIIRKYEYTTNYCGIKMDVTDDWCFYTERAISADLP